MCFKCRYLSAAYCIMHTHAGKSQLNAIRALFVTGTVKKMRDLEYQSPTLVARLMKLNHSRYINKLYKPQDFTISQVIALANILDLHPHMIAEVILKQSSHSFKVRKKSSLAE